MEKREMKQLLTYEDRKMIMEGEDLVQLANMYHLSVVDFLELFKLYLKFNQKSLVSGYSIATTDETRLTTPKEDFELKTYGEILVPEYGYEDMKKKVFDFAYTKCSEIGDKKYDHFGLSSAQVYSGGFDTILTKENPEYYSCIYSSSHGGWNQKVSNVKINKEEQEKLYSLIKR